MGDNTFAAFFLTCSSFFGAGMSVLSADCDYKPKPAQVVRRAVAGAAMGNIGVVSFAGLMMGYLKIMDKFE